MLTTESSQSHIRRKSISNQLKQAVSHQHDNHRQCTTWEQPPLLRSINIKIFHPWSLTPASIDNKKSRTTSFILAFWCIHQREIFHAGSRQKFRFHGRWPLVRGGHYWWGSLALGGWLRREQFLAFDPKSIMQQVACTMRWNLRYLYKQQNKSPWHHE